MDSGVIFDMDGVIVLTEEAHWLSWKAVAEGLGTPISYEVFLSCFGRVNPDCIRIMFGEGVAHAESLRIAEEKERRFRAIIGERVPLAPGLVELLDELARERFLLAVGSSAPRENIDLVLDGGGIRRHFRGVVDGGQVARGKPAPDVFLRGAELLNLPPARCVVVEDARTGIQAARGAGMIAVGVATTCAPSDLERAGAHAVFESVAAISASALRGMLP
ncbi:MAG TPA: HAD family phosphatase [Phycisphaerales bacterium]|nr:HAD family phosphatase [Phycisphaerales bacterium]